MVRKEQLKRLEASKASIYAKPKRLQGFTKFDLDRILPAIKVLHEAKVEYTTIGKFLSEFQASMTVLPL